MHVCVKFCPRVPLPTSDGAVEVTGQQWSLHVWRSPDAGPWYPRVEEASNGDEYRFFAGRLTGRTPTEPLPRSFTNVHNAAGDWSFPEGEPDGSWIALKFDRRNDEVSIACDLWVHQRWFYTAHADAWYFSNSLVYLREIVGDGLELEPRAIPYMLVFGHLPGHITPLAGVSLLLPGESIVVSRGELRRGRRERVAVKRARTGRKASDISSREWHETADDILRHVREAVAAELDGVGEAVVPLSGGMDSRFVLACALDCLPRERVVTYTFGDPRTLDQKIAKRVAQICGVEHVPLAMDRRPVDEVCADGFEQTEGMAYVFPNTPLGPDRKALLKPGSYVLSGYIGDCVFGSHDVNDTDPGHNTGEHVLRMAMEHAGGAYFDYALPLLASRQWDQMGYQDEVRATPGNSLGERYERWHYETHCVNRVQYHLFLFRNRAFYLTPFVQRNIWSYSLTLPEAIRANERGYYLAVKYGYPALHAIPTSRNPGFSAGLQSRTLLRAQNAWRLSLTKLDDMLWKATGRSLYFSPKQLYAHRHALRSPQYHDAVDDSIEQLKRQAAFDPRGLEALRNRYHKRLPVPPHVVRALFTLREWMRRYS